MSTDLREELDALARTQTFTPDPSAWDRGRRARLRTRVAAGAAAVAAVAVVAGAGVLATRPAGVGPAGDVVPDGAIPSRIAEPDGPMASDLAIGQASVAYVDDLEFGQPVLVSATTGEALRVELPDFPELDGETMDGWFHGPWLALSPDGRRLAYPAGTAVEQRRGVRSISTGWCRVVDLTTGESDLVDLPPGTGAPRAISWTADGHLSVDVVGDPTSAAEPPPLQSWTIDPATGDSSTSALTGVVAPGLGISAPYPTDDDAVRAMPFETTTGTDPERPLPRDLHPDGAVVSPVGWTANSLLVAQVEDDLVLLTSPDRPASEWIWRVLVPDLPATQSVSLAVDLVPDLTVEADQELTHDFDAAAPAADAGPDRLPYVLGGLMALLAGVAFVRMVQQQA